ncbi:MAG: glycosyltransferase family 4 protein [Candidatus Pacebacteria bacterium]|nr:glycosyltransferase family 4 protein [Candidatus Paceibacterota bacterium]MDP7466344.1 glycosyltransferase family 4 protein [Candidatus Paceibacterota bacterium]
MKRILIFSTSYYPAMAGAEIATKEITDRLKKTDFCFDMITLHFDKILPSFEKVGNVNVYRVTSLKLLFPFLAYFKSLSLHRKNKYDIVWSVMAGRNGFSALFFKLTYKKVKFLLTLQEGDRLSYPKERAGILWFVVGGLFKKIFIKADFIQVISKYLKTWAHDMGYKGEIEVIPNGADIQNFQLLITNFQKNKIRKELGIGKNEKVIITTSRLVEKNAIEDIIRALMFLPENFKLLIAGEGKLFYRLRELTNELRLTKRVLFLGNIKYEEISQYLHISDVFVRPSLSEGLGSSFIEAMAAGVPVIATEVGGITDFLKDGKTGLFTGVHDSRGISEKIEILMKDSKLREKIINNAKQMVSEKYDWNLITKNMKSKVFDKLEAGSLQLRENKNVLIATGLFPPDIGGPATYSKLLLDELPKEGFNITIASFGEVRHLPKFIRHIFYFFKVLNRGKNADIIFAQDPVSVGFPAVLASKVLSKKFILKIVGDYAWEQYQVENNKFISIEEFQTGSFGFKAGIRRKVERWVAKSAEKIIVPSLYLKKIISMWGIDEKNINVVNNGFKCGVECGNRETLRTLLQFKGNLIISIGRLVPWKGFDTLISIFPEIKKNIPDIKLIIAGSGPDKSRLQELIDEQGLQDDVALTGGLDKDVLLRYIKASDVFVLNTGYEGFSHQLLEVMDIGIPIVTTDIGGNPEIIENEKSGLLIGFNDEKEIEKSVIKLLNNKKYGNTLVRQAQKKVQEFSEEKMIKETIKILKNI